MLAFVVLPTLYPQHPYGRVSLASDEGCACSPQWLIGFQGLTAEVVVTVVSLPRVNIYGIFLNVFLWLQMKVVSAPKATSFSYFDEYSGVLTARKKINCQ